MGFHLRFSLSWPRPLPLDWCPRYGLAERALGRKRCSRRGPLVERRHQIIRRDSGSRDYAVVQGLHHSQSLLFGTAGDESDLQDNQVIRIFEAQERRRVQELASRQDVNDLEEVVRRNAQRAHQSILNRRRHLAETSLVVLSFEDVDLGDRHLHVLSKARLHPTRCWPGRRRGQQAQIRSPRLLAAMHASPHRAWLQRRCQIALVLRTISLAPQGSVSRPLWSGEGLWRGGPMRPVRP